MEWSATHIGWDEQIMLLWILLPPIFLFCLSLAFVAPLIFSEQKWPAAKRKVAHSGSPADAV